jgi:N6-L-threonylcarbamoyladenine synthase
MMLLAYDKTARLLGLNLKHGGGPALEEIALEGDPNFLNLSVSIRSQSLVLIKS